MKDLITRHKILNDEMIDILNKQIKIEAQSSAVYLSLGAWCDLEGFENSAKHFFNQAEEERAHQLKIFHYVLEMEGHPISPSVKESTNDFSSLKSVFEKALAMEIEVTQSIHKIYSLARKTNDYPTEEFMRWFIKEQVEEEFIARKILSLFDLYGSDKLSLAMLDRRVSDIKYDGQIA